MTFIASSFKEARIGERRISARSRRGIDKPATSPYAGVNMFDEDAVAARTMDLVAAYPATCSDLIQVVLSSWGSLTSSQIGRARIGVDLFPSPQVLGAFLHELVPLEMQELRGPDWRGDWTASEKDMVYLPDDRYSCEIKTSSHARQIFGNRSFGQQGLDAAKKEKSGYYLAVNFTGWSRDDATLEAPRVRLIRFGWLDHVDWLAQAASSGQAASLPPSIENAQLLTIFSEG